MFIYVFSLLCICINICNQVEAGPYFRTDYTYNPDFASFYKLHVASRTWIEAKLRCHREGAHLFFPDSEAEAKYVAQILKDKLSFNPHIWIGISDHLAEGDYETVTGKHGNDVYLKWKINEPNNSDDDEDCIELNDNAEMNDLACNKYKTFMCKKSEDTVTWNPFCEMPDTSYLYNGDLGKCYKFHSIPANWSVAHATCNAEQSYLAVINSQKEADYLVKMTADAPKDFKGPYLAGAVLIGFHNHFGEGYTTVLGTPLEESGYSKWGGGQPDHRDTEFCGSIFYNGGLNDMHCSSVCYYICEHDIGLLSNSLDERIGAQ